MVFECLYGEGCDVLVCCVFGYGCSVLCVVVWFVVWCGLVDVCDVLVVVCVVWLYVVWLDDGVVVL